MSTPPRIILHVDMDAFFASVEQRDHPEYRGKPVIVGAAPGKRGVVCAASYEARKFGVHSAMPVSRAFALCPHGIFIPPSMGLYSTVSREIMAIFADFSPAIEQISVDEAFIDMSGSEKLFGSPSEMAISIQNRVERELSLSCSIGVAPNKLLAKIASDFKKPHGITVVPFEQSAIEAWLAPMKVGVIWGIGEKSEGILAAQGIRTVGDLQSCSLRFLSETLGTMGKDLFDLCRGIDTRPVEREGREQQSISREQTYNSDCGDHAEWISTLLSISRDVAFRARKNGVMGKTVFITWRNPDFSRHSRRITLARPTDLQPEIFETACALLKKEESHLRKLRLLGLGITGFDGIDQPDLFDEATGRERVVASQNAVTAIMERFGQKSIFLGGEKRKR